MSQARKSDVKRAQIMNESAKILYDAGKIAKFFGVTKKTIREWCKEGKIPAFKIGKEWKVRLSDLQKLIDQKVHLSESSVKEKGLF